MWRRLIRQYIVRGMGRSYNELPSVVYHHMSTTFSQFRSLVTPPYANVTILMIGLDLKQGLLQSTPSILRRPFL